MTLVLNPPPPLLGAGAWVERFTWIERIVCFLKDRHCPTCVLGKRATSTHMTCVFTECITPPMGVTTWHGNSAT